MIDVASFVEGAVAAGGLAVAGVRWALRRRGAQVDAADQARRDKAAEELGALLGHLTTLGYESMIEDGVFVVETPTRCILKIPVAHLDPAALWASTQDLPRASEWHKGSK